MFCGRSLALPQRLLRHSATPSDMGDEKMRRVAVGSPLRPIGVREVIGTGHDIRVEAAYFFVEEAEFLATQPGFQAANRPVLVDLL
jgi:hypothetical protein